MVGSLVLFKKEVGLRTREDLELQAHKFCVNMAVDDLARSVTEMGEMRYFHIILYLDQSV